MSFKIVSLIEELHGQLQGPFRFLAVARQLGTSLNCHFNRIAQVHFDDPDIFQLIGDKPPKTDIFILAEIADEESVKATLWSDTEGRGNFLAAGFEPDRKLYTSPYYRKTNFRKKLSYAELEDLFTYLFDHPEVLDIIKPG